MRTIKVTIAAAAVGAAIALTAGADRAMAQEEGVRPSVDVSQIQSYQRNDWSREVTACDRLAAHPDDPEAVTAGVGQADMDLHEAIAVCQADVAADPDNPRLNYQLARVLAYSGAHGEGAPYRIAAIQAGYPQSLFVFGYIRVTGWDGGPVDACLGGELIRRSAHAGRVAGLVGFPHYVLDGRFADCPELNVDREEMLAFLDTAEEAVAGDFYRTLLVEQLRARIDAWSE